MPQVVAEARARFLVTVINPGLMPDTPASVAPRNHLKLACNDIEQPVADLIEPTPMIIRDLISFAQRWNRQGPLVSHCWAGVSRSTAAAFIVACTINPTASESTIAHMLREASPSATPNRLMVQLADDELDRDGRMIKAIAAIGEGQYVSRDCLFRLPSRVGV